MKTRLEAVPAGVLSSTFDVREGNAAIGRIVNRAFFHERGTLEAGGVTFSAYRERGLRTSYTLTSAAGGPVARAERQGLLREAYRVSFEGTELLLTKKALAMRDTYVVSGASGEVGRIVRMNLLSRRLLFEATSGVPREIGRRRSQGAGPPAASTRTRSTVSWSSPIFRRYSSHSTPQR